MHQITNLLFAIILSPQGRSSNGVEGVEMAQASLHDVVLMDIQMPGPLDGNEATAKLRKDNYRGAILALSGRVPKSAGANSFSPPFTVAFDANRFPGGTAFLWTRTYRLHFARIFLLNENSSRCGWISMKL